VGVVSADLAALGRVTVGVYNVPATPGSAATFAFNILQSAFVHLQAHVRTGSDYGVDIDIDDVSESLPLRGTELTLWGVPADHSHDNLRTPGLFCSGGPSEPGFNPSTSCFSFGGGSLPTASGLKPEAFLTNPTSCPGTALTTTLEADSWQEPGVMHDASFLTHDDALPPNPLAPTGCALLPFAASFSVVPDTTQADAPTGDRAVDLKIPQSQNPAGLATSHLREAVVYAPLGVTLNPGAADGLQACGDAQFGLHSAIAGTCPNASVIGTATVTTPLLAAPLQGQLFVGAPECSPCSQGDAQDGRLLRLFLQAEGSGVLLKAAGAAQINPVTGQLTVVFKELPQQPFSDLLLTFNGGPRAVFINPLGCGPATLTSSLTPWSGTAPITPSASFNVDWDGAGGACPATLPFEPGFSAGTSNPQAGESSPFTMTISRPDRNQVLSAVAVKLPPGVLATLSSVARCGEPQAAQGTCPATSRIGTATVAAGTGTHPYWFSGPVYLTGGYRGAPFGLSIAVPAVAGPFNLGTIVTRAAINVDPTTAQVTITSDPFPQFVDGIATHIQTVNVTTADRQSFVFNPTSCKPLSVTATVSSTSGVSVPVSRSFQAANCANLPFKPALTASAGGKASKASGASLDVKIASGSGQTNIGAVKVSLPKQLPSRLTTLQKACLSATFQANPASCPAASNVGSASVVTPILAQPLKGPAFLVSHGGAAFPDLEIVLQGEGVTLVLDGKTDIKKGITTSTFDSVPDAPISSFELKLPTGKYSVLTANLPEAAKYDLCGKSLAMPTAITGQNGAVVKQTTKIAISGCPKAKKAVKKKAKKAGKVRRPSHGKGREA
jgi:hypothetical protein